MDLIVGTIIGQSITLGAITSAITQAIKVTEGIPGLRNVKFIQAIFDFVDSASPAQVKLFAAIIAIILNTVSIYSQGGTIVSPQGALMTFCSYLSALGFYETLKAKKPEETPVQ